MDEFLNGKKTASPMEGPTLKDYAEREKLRWEKAAGFLQTTEETEGFVSSYGAKYAELGELDIYGLRNAMAEDEENKSQKFQNMFEAIDRFLNLAKEIEKDGNEQAKLEGDFSAYMFEAKQKTHEYIASRRKKIHVFDNGKRRLDIAERAETLLFDMTKSINDGVAELSEKQRRMAAYRQEGLSEDEIKSREAALKVDAAAGEELALRGIIDSGIFDGNVGEEEESKLCETWIAGNYKEELNRLLKNPEEYRTKEGKNTFLAFLMKKNHLLLANKLTIDMAVDADNGLTKGMPWVRESVKKYVDEKLSKEKMVTLKPEEILREATSLFGDYAKDNGEELARYEKRYGEIKGLIPDSDKMDGQKLMESLYRYPQAKELFTADEEDYKNQLEELSQKSERDEKVIRDRLKARYSVATRDEIRRMAMSTMGGMRLFGSTEMILLHLDRFCGMLQYTAPDLFIAERNIGRIMRSEGLPEEVRDSFINHMTNGQPERFFKIYEAGEKWQGDGEDYVKNFKTNDSYFRTNVYGRFQIERFSFRFSKKIWDTLENLHLRAGEMDKDDFKEEVKHLIELGKSGEGEKLSLREYNTRRKFGDDKSLALYTDVVEAEKKAIKDIGDSLDDQFGLLLLNGGNNGMSGYERLDDVYKGREEARKMQKDEKDGATEKRREKRREQIRKELYKHNVSKKRQAKILDEFNWLIDGVLEPMATEDDDEVGEDRALACERMNLERFGVHGWEDAFDRLEKYLPELIRGEVPEELGKVRERYEGGIATIQSYEDGRFAMIAEILADIPEVKAAMLSDDKKALEKCLEERIAPAFKDVMDALAETKEKAWYPESVLRQYVYTNRENIYKGYVTGDKSYYAGQMVDYEKKLFDTKLAANREKAGAFLFRQWMRKNDSDAKKGKKGTLGSANDGRLIVGDALSHVQYFSNDTQEDFEALFNYREFKKKAMKEFKDAGYRIEEAKAPVGIMTETDDGWVVVDKTGHRDATAGEKIRREKDEGRKATEEYLGLDKKEIHAIRQCKSLIRFGLNGQKTVTLKKSRVDEIRGMLKENLDVELPKVLFDAVVEEGASRSRVERWSKSVKVPFSEEDGVLVAHAKGLYRYYHVLTQESAWDDPMSDDEAQLFLLSLYAEKDIHVILDNPRPDEIRKVRRSEKYVSFRENYRLLRNLEEKELSEPALERERIDMARDLRLMLVTHFGVKGETGDREKYQRGKAYTGVFDKKLGEVIRRQVNYVEQSERLSAILRETVEGYDDGKGDLSCFYKDSVVSALREYFRRQLIEDMEEGREFDEEAWKKRAQEFYADKDNRDHILYEKTSITQEDLEKIENYRTDGDEAGEADIAKVIKNSETFFHDKDERYEKLDNDQKKLFAVALVMMDKGAIGLGTEGTVAALTPKNLKSKKIKGLEKQIENYVKGGTIQVNVDYREALYKLVNYGDAGIFGLTDSSVMSRTAYEKAIQFVETLFENREKFLNGEKDVRRMKSGSASIEGAFIGLGKEEQKNAADQLRKMELRPESVKDLLLSLAKKDQVSKSQLAVGITDIAIGAGALIEQSKILTGDADKIKKAAEKAKGRKKGEKVEFAEDTVFSLTEEGNKGRGEADETVNRYKQMSRIIRRLSKMDNDEIRLFVRILQDRTLLDKSMVNGKNHVDEEQRKALLEALTGDEEIQTETLLGYGDNESCYRAMVNSLSFQLRDDMFFKDKVLSKEHYESSSLNRTTLVDWKLVENAFAFLDDVRERRLEAYASRHAKDYIEHSGNEKAIKEYKNLKKGYGKNKEGFTRERFEEYIGINADEADSEEISNNWNGYLALDEKEKALFFKALANRDLLDYSKKNYMSSFFGKADRTVANESGRNALVDEYINSRMADGVGIRLDEGAYYDAMQSLFSTQVSDRVKLSKTKDMKDIFANERLMFMGRSTAIDWKLFRRALNLVTRAREELREREGDFLLYQGAGDLATHGRMRVDYSFLRRNFHKTGYRWSRYVGKRGVKVAKEEVQDTILGYLVNVADGVLATATAIGFKENGVVGGSINWLKKKADTVKEFMKDVDTTSTVTALETKAKPTVTKVAAVNGEKKDETKKDEKKKADAAEEKEKAGTKKDEAAEEKQEEEQKESTA